MSRGTQIIYSENELAWIKSHCHWPRKKSHQAFCEKFKRSDITSDNYKALCTRKGWVTGRSGCFEKGILPYNKGKKMAYNANTARTQFKKGHAPHNTHYLGHERISKDGYVEISVNTKNPYTGFERHYVLKHIYLWEKENGRLPKEMCLKCLDSNRQNTDPRNWEAIPRGVLPFLNGHRGHNYDEAHEELKPTILTLAKLKYSKGKIIKLTHK